MGEERTLHLAHHELRVEPIRPSEEEEFRGPAREEFGGEADEPACEEGGSALEREEWEWE